jgi:mRNA-degrading endonuclease RelE of RelBE toxin-antitoxin system
MTTYSRKQPSYREVLEYARRLSRKDQRRLQEELAKLSGVKLALPNKSASAIRKARKLADEIRKELKNKGRKSLNQTMRELRGRSWS